MSSDSSPTLERVDKLLSEVNEMLKNTTPEERREFAKNTMTREMLEEAYETLYGKIRGGARYKKGKGKSRHTKRHSRK